MGISQLAASSVSMTIHLHQAFALLGFEYCITRFPSYVWTCGAHRPPATSCILWSMVLWRGDFKVTEVWPGWQTSHLLVAAYTEGVSLKFRGNCMRNIENSKAGHRGSNSCRYKTSTAIRGERQHRQQGCRQLCRGLGAVLVPATCPHRQLAPLAAPGGGSPGPRQVSREPCLLVARGKGS